MKILMIITEAPPIMSGVARVADEITRRLRAAGHEVDVLSSRDIPRLELGEVRLSSMLWKGSRHVLWRARKYDIIHVHGPAPTFSELALLYAVAGWAGRGPWVVYTHHCEIELQGHALLCAAYNIGHRLLSRLADHVVTSTPSYARSFEPFVPPERISVIPWGVNSGSAVATKLAGLNVLYVGQLRPYKGLDVLLRAAQLVPEAAITVIGGGHREQHYRRLAEELGLQNVRFLGRASDTEMRQAYEQAHTLVLPSLTRAEAFGLVLLEGMAAGCVPIASQLPGLTDVVEAVGTTFPPGDVAALAAALQGLLNDPERTARLGLEARRRAEQFTWDLTAAAYERLFRDMVGRRRAVAGDWFPRRSAGSSDIGAYRSLVERAAVAIFEAAMVRFRPARASLMLNLPDEKQLMLVAHKGLDDALIGARVQSRRSIAGWVAAHGAPVLMDARHAPAQVRSYMHNPELNSSVSVPIVYNDQVIAVLNLAHDTPDRRFTPDDLRELATSALYASSTPLIEREINSPGVLKGAAD